MKDDLKCPRICLFHVLIANNMLLRPTSALRIFNPSTPINTSPNFLTINQYGKESISVNGNLFIECNNFFYRGIRTSNNLQMGLFGSPKYNPINNKPKRTDYKDSFKNGKPRFRTHFAPSFIIIPRQHITSDKKGRIDFLHNFVNWWIDISILLL